MPFLGFQDAQAPDIRAAYCCTIPSTPQIKKKLIDASYTHHIIVLAFHLSDDA